MVKWAIEEQQQVATEGARLTRTGEATSIGQAFKLAQLVLPKSRRRTISTTAKVPWFTEAIREAKKAPEPAQSAVQQDIATDAPAADANAPEAVSARARVVWREDEKRLLCATAAQLLLELKANGARDALEKAQMIALSAKRQRKIYTMTSVDDWYPEGLKKARAKLVRIEQQNALAEVNAKISEAAAAAQESAPAAVEPAAAPAAPAAPLALAPVNAGLASVFAGGWAHIREHLVQEIANVVAEGIHRGLASVQLAPPQQQGAETQIESRQVEARAHVPFVVDPNPKQRHPSILVVGLKGGNVQQIKEDFGSKLDLRFCDVDRSKDELRSMTEKADATVAVVGFLPHSYTDIIKARSRHYIESSGGMTNLRHELSRLVVGNQINGAQAHTVN